MAIGRNFEEALQKALRMVDEHYLGFDPDLQKRFSSVEMDEELENPTDKRILAIAAAMANGYPVERIHELTKIDRWFLSRMKRIVDYVDTLKSLEKDDGLNASTLLTAKQLGFSDKQIAK